MTEHLNVPFHGDILDFLRLLPAESVQTCITSPPYLGKRNYFIPPRVWDEDDEECMHVWQDKYLPPTRIARQRTDFDPKWTAATKDMALTNSEMCSICGAWKGVLGDEPFPELFIKHLVDIFREVRRVLRKDGTIWVNMGDSAVDSGGTWSITDEHIEKWAKKDGGTFKSLHNHLKAQGNAKPPQMGRQNPNYKKKDLFGIPWMLAFALRNDGWYLRQDIIWAKPNPYPEPVKDRPTRSHEYIFLLAKSPKYFYDRFAVLEPAAIPDAKNIPFRKGSWGKGTHKGLNDEGRVYDGPTPMPSDYTPSTGTFPEDHTFIADDEDDAIKKAWLKSMGGGGKDYAGVALGDPESAGAQNPSDMKRRIIESVRKRPTHLLGRNRRSVWHIKTKPENWRPILPKDWDGQKHFASYPQAIPELCIKAGTAPNACSNCGDPYQRCEDLMGWEPSCLCAAPPGKCVVLDPFMGTFTTGVVAEKLGRSWYGCDISEEFIKSGILRLKYYRKQRGVSVRGRR